jgi:hypothetical protein
MREINPQGSQEGRPADSDSAVHLEQMRSGNE